MKKEEIIVPIIIIILILIVIGYIVPSILEPQYSMCDVHMWCCRNLNETISPTGENCTNIINNIYGGQC